MKYNGVGLQSAKGSSTSGHVTKALSAQKKDANSHKNYYKRKQLEGKFINQTRKEGPEKRKDVLKDNVIEQRSLREAHSAKLATKNSTNTFVEDTYNDAKPKRVLDIHDLLALKENKQIDAVPSHNKSITASATQENQQVLKSKPKAHNKATIKREKTIYDD
ncbi:hypothetical protein ACO0RG_002729 [Hanseniaspora osmophila]